MGKRVEHCDNRGHVAERLGNTVILHQLLDLEILGLNPSLGRSCQCSFSGIIVLRKCKDMQVSIMKLCIFSGRVMDGDSSSSVVEVTYPGWIPIFHFVISQHENSLSDPLIHISLCALLPTSLTQR